MNFMNMPVSSGCSVTRMSVLGFAVLTAPEIAGLSFQNQKSYKD